MATERFTRKIQEKDTGTMDWARGKTVLIVGQCPNFEGIWLVRNLKLTNCRVEVCFSHAEGSIS